MMKNHTPIIAGISDVSLGYGSPQIIALMRSISRLYTCKTTVYEPDQVERQPFSDPEGWIEPQRISLTTHPHTSAGRVEYLRKAARELNRLRPDMLVIFCTYTLPVLFKLNYRPKFTLYVSLESIQAYGKFDLQMNHAALALIDAVVFPEENRARLDGARCGLLQKPFAIVYNAANPITAIDDVIPPDQRLRRVLYSGVIDSRNTLADFYLEPAVKSLPIDLYGKIATPGLKERLFESGDIRYHGFVDAEQLNELRRHYAYALVMWAPVNENQLYACPNKFFDAIAAGVPPISAPHPQIQTILHRYQCGYLMPDWSLEGFKATLNDAMDNFGSENYQVMVANCRRAVSQELNWDAQFIKVKRLLPERFFG